MTWSVGSLTWWCDVTGSLEDLWKASAVGAEPSLWFCPLSPSRVLPPCPPPLEILLRMTSDSENWRLLAMPGAFLVTRTLWRLGAL